MTLSSDEMAGHTPTIGETYTPPRQVCQKALIYIHRNAQGAEDARIIAEHLGLDHLIDESRRRTHAVS